MSTPMAKRTVYSRSLSSHERTFASAASGSTASPRQDSWSHVAQLSTKGRKRSICATSRPKSRSCTMTNECSCAFSKMRWGNIARNSSTSERRASLFANFRRSGVRTPMIEPGSIFGMSFA